MSDRSDQSNANPSHGQGTATAAASASRPNQATRHSPNGKVVSANRRQYVIALRGPDATAISPFGFQTMGVEALEQNLKSIPEIELIGTIGRTDTSGSYNGMSESFAGVPNVLIARMPEDKAEMLKQQGCGQVVLEVDELLHLSHYDPEPSMVTGIGAAVGPALSATILVLNKDNSPVREAEVSLFGCMATASGLTDERGQVTLSLAGETVQSLRSLYVKPKSDYWSFYLKQPALDTDQPNLVSLRSLSESFPDFPRQSVFGWGQRLMRLDQLPPQYRAQGARVALIDSGVATSHVDLQRIKTGIDTLHKKNGGTAWNQDTVSHGSTCAGIIGAAENSLGIRGFAPDCELHVCKVFPGGRISHLIDALEYCIENHIDVANVSLAAMPPSEVLEQQLRRAKRFGLALIASVGNSAGPVEYPASSPHVLGVSAIGKWGEFPMESYHAHTVGMIEASGIFSPTFTCYGPEVDVCAPGVAILSTVPPNNYAVRDGTSIAAAHVTGLAALVLAHHPDFQGAFKTRNADRVDRLFQILRASAQPVNLRDPRRTGFGIPDVLVAMGLAPPLWLGGMVRQFGAMYNPYTFAGAGGLARAAAGMW